MSLTTRWNVNRQAHLNGWANLEAGLSSPTRTGAVRPLIFAAHPDDETLGAAAVMMRYPETRVVYLTDGAPRDPQLRSPDAGGSRSDYAKLRSLEAMAAIQIADLGRDRVHWLGAVDQEAIHEAIPEAHHLLQLIREISPDVLITHPYEGGHPDHDAAALIARLASDLLSRSGSAAPDLLEMTSYHARDGRLITGEFLPLSTQLPLKIELRSAEVNRKKLMIGCYQSQWRVLQNFGVDTEMLRLAPLYDFCQPPHAGKLWYECLGWPMTGTEWRSLAAGAINDLELRCA